MHRRHISHKDSSTSSCCSRRKRNSSSITMRVGCKRKSVPVKEAHLLNHCSSSSVAAPVVPPIPPTRLEEMDTLLQHRLHCTGSANCCGCRVESGLSCAQYPTAIGPKRKTPRDFNKEMSTCQPNNCHPHRTTAFISNPTQPIPTTPSEKNDCESTRNPCPPEEAVEAFYTNETDQRWWWWTWNDLSLHHFPNSFTLSSSGRRHRVFWRRAFSWLPSVRWTRRRMTSFLYTFFVLLSTCLPVSHACSSRSTPKPRPPSPTQRPNITIQTYTCPPEYDAHYCLNGATCFTVKIGESILYNCECAEGYMGQRCEFKDLDGSYLPSKRQAMLEQAGVTGSLAITVILVVIILFYLYVRGRRRNTDRIHGDSTDIGSGDVTDGENNYRVERKPFDPQYYLCKNLHHPRNSSQSLHSPPSIPLHHHQSERVTSRIQSYHERYGESESSVGISIPESISLPCGSSSGGVLSSSSNRRDGGGRLSSSPSFSSSHHPTVHKKVTEPPDPPPGHRA